MRAFLIIVGIMVCLTPVVGQAGEHQERRIEELEQENLRLVYEISRLRGQIQGQQQRCQSGYRRPYSYNYGQSPLSGANRSLSELNRTKRELDQLRR